METVEQRAVAEAKTFMRHNGLCGIVGGYGYCTCGFDEAVAALDAIPPSGIAEAVKERCAEKADSWQTDDAVRAAVLMGMGEGEIHIAQMVAKGIFDAIRALDLSDMGGKTSV